MKTAGMANGTPDWQLDMMYESEAAQAWEDAQEEPKPLARYGFDSLNRAWAALETIRTSFEHIEEYMVKASEIIQGTPEADKLASLNDSLTDIRLEVNEIKTTLKKEGHEAWIERRYAG